MAATSAPPLVARVAALRGRIVCLWVLLLIGVCYLPWTADIAYGGDEHYHLKALVMGHLLDLELVSHGWFPALGLAWLGAGIWLAARHAGGLQSPPGIWACAGLALAACAPWLYPAEVLGDAFNQDRMLRYPGSQPWLSAWLWEFTRGNWGSGVLFGFEVLRFTSVLALFALGLVLMQERRWRKAPPVNHSSAGSSSSPSRRCSSTARCCIWNSRSSRCWSCSCAMDGAGCSPLRNGWRAATRGGPHSRSASSRTPASSPSASSGSRALVRGTFLTRRNEWSFSALRAEARVAFVTLGPGVLYLLLRAMHGSRPYQPHFENLLSAEIWLQAARGVAEQFGVLWLPALAGAWLLARRRAWAQLIAAGTLFGGMWLFHLIEEPRWVGLARFNLLLLPAVLVLAWEGLGALLQRRAATMVALLLLLAGNAGLSPVDHTGHRAVWGGSGERWYDYTDCLADLRKLKHNAHLAIANVAHSYGIGMTLQRLDWWVHVSNLPVANPNDALATLQAALTLATKGEFDFVIFRWETDPPIALDHQHAGYVRMRDYPSQGGTLTVFARRASGFQSPTP